MLVEILREGLYNLATKPKADWWLPAGAHEPDRERAPIGLSEMNACIRKLWFQNNNEPETNPTPADMIAVWQMGNFMERVIIAGLQAGGLPVSEAQTNLSYSGIPGHNDGLICSNDHPILLERLGPDRYFILEIKSGKGQKVKALQRKGVREIYPEYFMQMQMYIAAYEETFGRKLDGAFFIIGNKAPDFKQGWSYDAWYEELVPAEPEEARFQMEYVKQQIVRPEPPEIPYPSKAPLCYHCPFQARCWRDRE